MNFVYHHIHVSLEGFDLLESGNVDRPEEMTVPQGAIVGSALVPASPIMFSLTAIIVYQSIAGMI
jgi:hypothetical protein